MASRVDEYYDQGQDRIRHQLKRMNSIQIHSVASEIKMARTSIQNIDSFSNTTKYQIKRLLDDVDSIGEVIKLAYVTGNDEVHIDQESLYLLQRYSSQQIAFIGFLGAKESGKSSMLDTILNVSYAEGNQFTSAQGYQRQKGIYLWTLPFSYNHKLKIFFIQATGIDFQSKQFQRQDEILIDLILLLCSSLAIFSPLTQQIAVKRHIFQKQQSNSPIQQNLVKQIIKSSQRITKQNRYLTKQDNFWPQNIFYFNRRKNIVNSALQIIFNFCNYVNIPSPLLKEQPKQQLLQCFKSNNMKGINRQYIRGVAQFGKNIILQTATKQYEYLKYTGNICCKLLINSVKYMNKKPRIKINKICASIIKQIYESSYAYHIQIYNNNLKDYFNSEDPSSFDQVINGFKLSCNFLFESFNQVILNEELHEIYETKLLKYIQQKQAAILKINEKKTEKTLRQIRKDIDVSKVTAIVQIKNLIMQINDIEPQLDHNRCQMIGQRLFKYTKNIQSRIIDEKLNHQKIKIEQIKKKIRQRYKIFKEIQSENQVNKLQNDKNQKDFKTILKQMNQFDKEIKNHKRQIEAQKKFQKEYLITKQSKKQYAESLLQKIRELQEKKRDNLKIIDEIMKEYEYYPQILDVQKKIQQRQRLIKDLQKLQSKLQMSKLSILKNSIGRSAVQKNKESNLIHNTSVQPNPTGSGRVIKRLSKK